MTTQTQTVRFPNEVAQKITAETWTQGQGNWDGTGPTCLHGHIRRCELRPGDEYIISAVFDGEDTPGSMLWNDAQDSFESVRDWAAQAEITDEMLEETFGPQWRNMVALIRRITVFTNDDIVGLVNTQDIVQESTRITAQNAARDDYLNECWNSAWYGAWRAIHDIGANTNLNHSIWNAVRDAVRAIVVADLVDPNTDWTEKELNTLLAPFREVVGDPLDPDTVEEWLQIGA